MLELLKIPTRIDNGGGFCVTLISLLISHHREELNERNYMKYKIIKIGGRELKVPYASQSELEGEIAEFKEFKKNPIKYIKKTLNSA